MKRIAAILIGALAAGPLWAASTCQTRVDKNINKSTTEKIIYCLTDEPEPVVKKKTPEVIFSDVYSASYPRPKNQKNTGQKTANSNQKTTVTKKYSSAPVSLEYEDRTGYPPFRNDTYPRMNPASANDTALQALRQETAAAKGAQKPTKVQPKPKKSGSKLTRKASVQKPAQTSNAVDAAVPQDQLTGVQVQPAPTVQEASKDTPPSELVEDEPLGPADFGYDDEDLSYGY